MSNTLNLWYEDQLVGELWNNDLDRIGFRYSNDWLDNENRFPISIQLPLQEEDFTSDEGKAHRFFSNLLPEGPARAQIIRDLKISDSEFLLLEAIGGECAGALNILHAESEPVTRKDWKYSELSDEKLELLIQRKGYGINFRNDNDAPVRLSLAGAQNKCPVLVKNGQRFLPDNEAATSHILKFQLADFKHVPAYETILMKLAESIGLNVASIELCALDETPGENPEYSFVEIKRYDRVEDQEGSLQRLHQEDFCQALGIGYNQKYQSDGGPGFSDCLQVVRNFSDQPTQDAQALIEWQVFNFLTGNSDGHAKNISMLYLNNNTMRLAPFYDLVCTRAIERISADLAFSIGGEFNPGSVYKHNWIAFAQDLDISFRFLTRIVNELIEKIIAQLPDVVMKFNNDYGEYKPLQRVEKIIQTQCRRASHNLK